MAGARASQDAMALASGRAQRCRHRHCRAAGCERPGPLGLRGVSLARPEHAERTRSRDLAAWGVPAGRFPSDDPGNCKIDGSFRLP